MRKTGAPRALLRALVEGSLAASVTCLAGVRNLSGDKNQFVISIKEWMKGQDYQQLNAFQEKAVFHFLLRAPGHELIRDHFWGTHSALLCLLLGWESSLLVFAIH